MAATTTNQKLKDWVEHWAGVFQPDEIEWCDGSEQEWERLTELLVAGGTFERLAGDKRPNSFLALSDPGDVARVEDRTFICSEQESDAGATNNWRDPAEMRVRADRLLHRGHARPHDVRRPVLDGPARVADRPHRRAAHRLRLRGRQHADHDPHGPGPPRRAGRRRRVRPLPPLRRLPARRRRGHRPARRPLAVRRRQQVHRALPRDPRDLVLRLRVRRQRPAGQEVLRAAHRLDHGPRRRVDGRAHAHPRRDPARGREALHRRRVPVGLRQDQHGDDDPDPAGVDRRDGGRRHRVDEVRRRRPAPRDQPGGRVLRRGPRHRRRHQSERSRDVLRELDLHQRRPHRRRRRVVGGPVRGARPPDRLEGQRLDAARATRRPPTPTPGSPPRRRSARRSPPSGRTRRACPSRRSSSAAAGPPTCRW